MTAIICPHCQHNQRLYAPTMQKLKSYRRRIVRCSKCHWRIKVMQEENQTR